MKNIFTIILLTLLTIQVKANTEKPKLILNVYYTQASDTLFLEKIRTSNEACCRYEFVTIKSSQNKIEVCSKNNSLGTIYGYPTERFLLDIYDRYFK